MPGSALCEAERTQVPLTAINRISRQDRLDHFSAWLRQTGSAPNTVRIYRGLVSYWLDRLDASDSPTPALAWLEWDAPESIRRLTGYACRRYAQFIRDVFAEAIDLGVPRRLPPPSRPTPRPVTDPELSQLLRVAKLDLPYRTSVSMRVWIHLMDELGLRRGESAFGWDRVDFDRGCLTVTGKTGERTLPLSDTMHRRLRWLQDRHPVYPWLGDRGQPLSPDVLYVLFKRVARATGLGHLRPHLLRHRRLTRICRTQLGKDPIRVLRFAGQSNIASLSYYYQVTHEDLRPFLRPHFGNPLRHEFGT